MPACALVVEFDLLPGKKAEFLDLMNGHAKLTLAEEPGCRQFDVLQPEGDDNRILLVEVYADRAAYETHRQCSRMPGVNATVGTLTSGRKITVCAIE